MRDNFGNRMKLYEPKDRFMPLLPVIARLDGKRFSKFTLGYDRPYDIRITRAMIDTTKKLIEETNAKIGYTQSDEITLVWHQDQYDSEIWMDGRVQKMCSILASIATAHFNRLINDQTLAYFDARVFQVPTQTEAANAVLWREQDATKNSISMAAHHYFGHAATMNLTGPEKQEKLWQEAGVNFNDYPSHFKRGTFVQRKTFTVLPEEMTDVPVEFLPTEPVTRSRIQELDMPKFSSVSNRVGVIFNSENPILI